MFKTVFRSLILSSLAFACATLNAQDEPIAQAVPESPKPAVAASEAQSKPTVRPITVSVSLVDDATTITGTLTETTTLSIKTAFGIAELPLNEVAGVRFPRGDDTSTTVVMLNGDSITGATDLKFATVDTSWGSAKINGQSIASMMMVPGLAWQSVDVLGSKRWQLIEAPRTTGQSSKLGNAPIGQPSTGTVLPQASSGPAGTALPRASSQSLPTPLPPRTGN